MHTIILWNEKRDFPFTDDNSSLKVCKHRGNTPVSEDAFEISYKSVKPQLVINPAYFIFISNPKTRFIAGYQ